MLLLTLVPAPAPDDLLYSVETTETPPTTSTDVIQFDGRSATWPNSAVERTVKWAASRISLHILRDHHAPSLEPALGHLKLLGRTLQGDAATMVAAANPAGGNALPFFALAWPLTLFTHDLPTLKMAQRVMDVILAFGPRFVLFLASAFLERRTQELADEREELEEDPSLLHHFLQQLPQIVVNSPSDAHSPSTSESEQKGLIRLGSYTLPAPPEAAPLSTLLQYAHDIQVEHDAQHELTQVKEIMNDGSVLVSWGHVLGPSTSRTHGIPDQVRNHISPIAPATKLEHTPAWPTAWNQRDCHATSIVQETTQIVQVDRLMDDAQSEPEPEDDDSKTLKKLTAQEKPRGRQRDRVVAVRSRPHGSALMGLATVAVGAFGVGLVLYQSVAEDKSWSNPFVVAAADALRVLGDVSK